ncbi:U3-containing 90S pre-ribosomal complex subunit-domain containing protein [Terfezia claveryi]|nr:U3-containing 90S pre-ribosomal complex subunit-domain containing protein [Terfezia claveryi]
MGNDFEDDFDDTEVLATVSPSDSPQATIIADASKSKRKREAYKAKKAKRRKRAIEDNDEAHLIFEEGKGGVNTAIAKLGPQLIADYVGQKVKRFEKELSAVELEDRYIPASAFLDMTSWQKDRNLENLSEFMETFSRYKGRGASLKKASPITGTPHTLIITAAAIRSADISRAVRSFQSKENAVAKLFAKHIKLKDSIEYCQKTRIGIGVGTPGRVLALIKEDVLKLDDLKRIIIDASQIDEKKRGIFDIKETQKDVMDLLCSGELRKRLSDGSTSIIFY